MRRGERPPVSQNPPRAHGAVRAGSLGEGLARTSPGPQEHRDVVDEPGRADPGRDGEQGLALVPLGHVLERRRVDEDEVVDEGERLLDEHLAGGPPDRRGALDGASGAGTQPSSPVM